MREEAVGGEGRRQWEVRGGAVAGASILHTI